MVEKNRNQFDPHFKYEDIEKNYISKIYRKTKNDNYHSLLVSCSSTIDKCP